MKRILLATITLTALSGAVAVAAPAPKVTICHATSSVTNPWVRIVTSENGINGHFLNNGTTKAGHESDLLFLTEVPCPTVPPENPPEEEPEEPETPPKEETPDETNRPNSIGGKVKPNAVVPVSEQTGGK